MALDSAQPQRNTELWFEDGTLVLQAGSVIFKIYKGLLAKRSPVFQDMLSLPQPQEQDTMEGCPMIFLHDSAEDLSYFLKAIYDSSFFERGLDVEFRVVTGILRLSTKYDVQSLRRRAVSQLTDAFPSTLQAWDSRKISDFEHIPFVALQLAKEAGISEVLPAVLYFCSMQPIGVILDGIRWEGTHFEMDASDKRTCLLAKQKLEDAHQRRIFAFLRAYHVTGCSTGDMCNTRRLEWSAHMDYNSGPLMRAFDWSKFSVFVCRSCLTFSKTTFEAARQNLWEDLPGFFDLPSWSQLLSSQD